MLGGRNGARNAAAFDEVAESEPRTQPGHAPVAKGTTATPAAGPAQMDPSQLMQHMNDVQARLTDEERAVARAAAAEMGPDEVQHWIATLGGMSIEQAVVEVRRLIAGSNKGGAS